MTCGNGHRELHLFVFWQDLGILQKVQGPFTPLCVCGNICKTYTMGCSDVPADWHSTLHHATVQEVSLCDTLKLEKKNNNKQCTKLELDKILHYTAQANVNQL